MDIDGRTGVIFGALLVSGTIQTEGAQLSQAAKLAEAKLAECAEFEEEGRFCENLAIPDIRMAIAFHWRELLTCRKELLPLVEAVPFLVESGIADDLKLIISSSEKGVALMEADGNEAAILRQFQHPNCGIHDTAATLAKYLRLEDGMSYEEVVGICNRRGTELSRSNIAGIRTVMYSWSNPDGSNMNVTFQNGGLVGKAKSV